MDRTNGEIDVRSWWSRAVLLSVLSLVVAAPVPAQAAPSPAAVPGEILGDYQSAIRGADGEMDIPATIAELSGAHVTDYWYLVCHFTPYSQLEWDQLPAFLTAAAAAGIKVWVYLCPPSEGHTSATGSKTPDLSPYQWDYVAWAQHIAQLSLTDSNLVGYTMDDFTANSGPLYPVAFTPAYTRQMVEAGKAINPALKFYPIEYYSDLVGLNAKVSAYRTIVDGVIFPYRDESAGGTDHTNSANMTTESADTYQTVGCVSGEHCYQVSFPPATKSAAGWTAGVEQQVDVSPASSYSLTFSYADDYLGTTSEYHYFQITVDGVVAWSEDMAGNRHERRAIADLTSELAGKTKATIGLRVWERHAVSNFHISVTFDDLVSSGFTVQNPDFEDTTNWTPTSSSPLFTLGYVNNLPKIDMVYAAKLKSAPTPPTAAYVGDATSRALALTPSKFNVGTVIYQLNITGADIPGSSYAACYPTIAGIYGGA